MTRSFGNLTPSALKHISPPTLFALLDPYRRFFERRKCILPERSPTRDEDGAFDYDAIFRLISSHKVACPAKLEEALYYINSVASDEHSDALIDAAASGELNLDFGDSPTAADIAATIWLKDPRIIEERHAEGKIEKPATLTFFRASKATPPPTSYKKLGAAELDAMAAAMSPWFEKRHRGRGCRVFMFERDEGFWIVIRHGHIVQREPSYSLRGDHDTITRFRGQRHDAIWFRPSEGEIGIRASGLVFLRFYSKIVGRFLFGDDDYFKPAPKYTLAPLRQGARMLDTADCRAEITWLTLKRLVFEHPGRKTRKVTIECDDVFDYFANTAEPFPTSDLFAATFRVQFALAKNPRDFSISSETKAKQFDDEDHLALERFLMTRGFIIAHAPATDASAQLTMVST